MINTKQPKKLKRDYKIAASAYNLNPDDWMLLKDGDTYITIIHKVTEKTKIIDKYARSRKGGIGNGYNIHKESK